MAGRPAAAAPADPGDWSLAVEVVEGRQLPKMDRFSKSDPFCRLRCGTQLRETRVIKNNLNPKWGERFVFPAVRELVVAGDTLNIDVFDKNR